MQTLLKILWGYLRASMYICLGTGLPTVITCMIPFHKLPLAGWRFGLRISLVYSLFPNMCLIVDAANRMPAYMGFFVSKAISMAWAVVKAKTSLPNKIPGEKILTFAILAGLVGVLSAKNAMKKSRQV